MRFKFGRGSYLHVAWVDQDNMLQGVIHNIPLAPRTACTQANELSAPPPTLNAHV